MIILLVPNYIFLYMTWLHFYFPFLFVLSLFFLEGLKQRKGNSDADRIIHTVLFHLHHANIIIIHIEIVYTNPLRIEHHVHFLFFFSIPNSLGGKEKKRKMSLMYSFYYLILLKISMIPKVIISILRKFKVSFIFIFCNFFLLFRSWAVDGRRFLE